MDDFNVSALHESKNEWGSRLVTILTPLLVDGYKSILDESIKMCKEVHEQIIDEPIKQSVPVSESNQAVEGGSAPAPMPSSRLSFNDIDSIRTDDGTITSVVAPKSIPQLEERAQQRRIEEAATESAPDMSDKLHISDQTFSLDALDVHSIEEPALELLPDLLMDEIEVLE